MRDAEAVEDGGSCGRSGAGDCDDRFVRRRGNGGDRPAGDIAGNLHKRHHGDGDDRERVHNSDENGGIDAGSAVMEERGLVVAVAAEGEEGDVDVAENGKEEGVVDADMVGKFALRKRNDGAADDGGNEKA